MDTNPDKADGGKSDLKSGNVRFGITIGYALFLVEEAGKAQSNLKG